jgi:hypothetical protein
MARGIFSLKKLIEICEGVKEPKKISIWKRVDNYPLLPTLKFLAEFPSGYMESWEINEGFMLEWSDITEETVAWLENFWKDVNDATLQPKEPD